MAKRNSALERAILELHAGKSVKLTPALYQKIARYLTGNKDEAISEKDAEIQRLGREISDLKVSLKQAQGNNEAFLADALGYRQLATLALLPLASVLGSSALQVALVSLARSAGTLEKGTGSSEVVTNIYYSKIAAQVGQLSGHLSATLPEHYQKLNRMLYQLRESNNELIRLP